VYGYNIVGVNAPANEKKNCELCGTHEKATRSGWLIRYFTGNRGVHFNGCVGGYKRYRLFYRRKKQFNTEDIINEDDNPKIIGTKQENGVQDSKFTNGV
jgi:hypothetical protein